MQHGSFISLDYDDMNILNVYKLSFLLFYWDCCCIMA